MRTLRSDRVVYIILRYMRRPILVLITVYAVSMMGWILIPGIDAAGKPTHLSFFHAFYFLTYTATTTGFGELPSTFTEAQRMWGIVSLYTGVIAWFYALGSIAGLVQNTDFQRSVAERRFAKRVARLKEPFYIVCGYGNVGALLTRGLTDAGMTVVVIDREPERIRGLMLRDYGTEVSGLVADAIVPEHLIEAGLSKDCCRGVIALTQNEEVNLKISVTARLLNPRVWVVTQSTSEAHEDTLATLGENVHIVDPFQTYAKYLGATIATPGIHTLNQWLVGTPGALLSDRLMPPRGTWILCGYGRMGRWLRQSLEKQGLSTIVIEPGEIPPSEAGDSFVTGRASQKNLLLAGIETAAGIVACTNRDSDNLSIVLNAKALNPNIFCIVRQNRYRNQMVFHAANADLIMMPSLTSARRILLLLIAPLMKNFFEGLRATQREGNEAVIREAIDRIQSGIGGGQPRVWTVSIDKESAPTLLDVIEKGGTVGLADILRDPRDRTKSIASVPLVVRSGEEVTVLPTLDTLINSGDEVLFCGTQAAFRDLEVTMHNEYVLSYLITGFDPPRGWVMSWFRARYAPQG